MINQILVKKKGIFAIILLKKRKRNISNFVCVFVFFWCFFGCFLIFRIFLKKRCLFLSFGSSLGDLFKALHPKLDKEWDTVSTNINISWANNTSVDSAWDAVELLLVCLWKFVALVNCGIWNILCRWCFNHILCCETLDCFILWDKAAAVHAVDCSCVASVHLWTAVIPTLNWHLSKRTTIRHFFWVYWTCYLWKEHVLYNVFIFL